MSQESQEMEGKTAAQRAVIPSQNCIETAPRGKGWQRGRNKRGQYRSRPVGQDSPKQFRNDRRDGYNHLQRHDKRPPPRAAYHSNRDVDKSLDSVGTLDTPVFGAGPVSKKYGTSLNHLLNFKYTPREKPSKVHYFKAGSKKHSFFNKEHFIQANCQFVVRDAGDYSVCAMDPDVLVDWGLVEQVCIFSHEVPSCPICLFPPVAAKITRCGHIYCWSCMLHYLSLSENSWHKCPICYESVHQKDLKSVVAMETHQFAVGEHITLRLMKREKNSVLAVPKAQWQEREFKPFGINDEVDTRYAKLLLASPEEVLQKVVIPEESALTTQLMEAQSEQSEEQSFIEAALQQIKARHDSLSDTKDSAQEVTDLVAAASIEPKKEDESKDHESRSSNWRINSTAAIEGVDDYEAAFSDEELTENATENATEKKSGLGSPKQSSDDTVTSASDVSHDEDGQEHTECTNGKQEHATGGTASSLSSNSSIKDVKYYYFYQADDGQNIFLHPVNARCLVTEYGSLEHCPETITAKIIEMEVMSQTEDTRKRYRYLSHLPLTCEFVISELDLKPPLLSRGTLDFFQGDIQQRRQHRQKKMKMERKRERKMEGNASTSNSRFNSRASAEHLNLSSEVDFPSQVGHVAMSPPAFSSPSPFMQFAAASFWHDEDCGIGAGGDEGARVGQDSFGSSPPSFAQALRGGKALENSKQMKKPKEHAEAVGARPSVISSEGNSDPEDYVPVPTFQSAFSEALVTSDWSVPRAGDSLPRKEGTRKTQKKGKKKLLFTTGSFMKYS